MTNTWPFVKVSFSQHDCRSDRRGGGSEKPMSAICILRKGKCKLQKCYAQDRKIDHSWSLVQADRLPHPINERPLVVFPNKISIKGSIFSTGVFLLVSLVVFKGLVMSKEGGIGTLEKSTFKSQWCDKISQGFWQKELQTYHEPWWQRTQKEDFLKNWTDSLSHPNLSSWFSLIYFQSFCNN